MTDGETERRTIGRTDESDFIGRCRVTSSVQKKRLVKRSERITQQPKLIENSNIDLKSVTIKHSKNFMN